jgi:outer membrane murein-binding lipoprotein Lpp
MNMKTILLAGSLVLTCNAVMAQARETTITLGKDKINAVKVEVNAPVKQVQDALSQQFVTTGVKPRKGSAKSVVYEDVVVPAITRDTVDIWTRVQKNGNNSIIYLGVKDQQGNYISGESDTSTVEKIKDFLYNFARAQNYSSNDLEIGSLMDSVRTDQVSFEQFTTEKSKLESQIKELTSQLQALEQKQTAARSEMEKRRQRLEQLTAVSEGNVKTDKTKKTDNEDQKQQK